MIRWSESLERKKQTGVLKLFFCEPSIWLVVCIFLFFTGVKTFTVADSGFSRRGRQPHLPGAPWIRQCFSL